MVPVAALVRDGVAGRLRRGPEGAAGAEGGRHARGGLGRGGPAGRGRGHVFRALHGHVRSLPPSP